MQKNISNKTYPKNFTKYAHIYLLFEMFIVKRCYPQMKDYCWMQLVKPNSISTFQKRKRVSCVNISEAAYKIFRKALTLIPLC